jgi:ADP-ribose pyrophosphatase YjhB (NUDIX family)
MVPNYATAIEGATGLCFSPDGARILLVWERGSWSTPGGAVNAGESKIDALARELYEEVGVEVCAVWLTLRHDHPSRAHPAPIACPSRVHRLPIACPSRVHRHTRGGHPERVER